LFFEFGGGIIKIANYMKKFAQRISGFFGNVVLGKLSRADSYYRYHHRQITNEFKGKI
jgi:hypothetical protein